MKKDLLRFLRCADCRHEDLELVVWNVDESNHGAEEIREGHFRCPACESCFPIIDGIPRMLPAGLRPVLEPYHDGFFRRHPELRVTGDGPEAPAEVVRTLSGFSDQHVNLNDGSRELERWRDTFFRTMGVGEEFFLGKAGLDVGCGYGRHLYWAARLGREVVGMDLSESVTLAAKTTREFPRCHVVQGDVFHLPFRPGVFDYAYSIGVLHHTPDPKGAFSSLLPAVKPGGAVRIWVYGLDGMRWWYRVSHLKRLRQWTNRLPPGGQRMVTLALTAVLEALVWFPCRVALLFPGGEAIVRGIPLGDGCRRPLLAKFRSVHDRIQPPVTHYHTADELGEWFRSSGLRDVSVRCADGRGWTAGGLRDATPTLTSPAGYGALTAMAARTDGILAQR